MNFITSIKMSRPFKDKEVILLLFDCFKDNPYFIISKYIQPKIAQNNGITTSIALLISVNNLYRKIIILLETYSKILSMYDFNQETMDKYIKSVKIGLLHSTGIDYTDQTEKFISISNVFIEILINLIIEITNNFDLRLEDTTKPDFQISLK